MTDPPQTSSTTLSNMKRDMQHLGGGGENSLKIPGPLRFGSEYVLKIISQMMTRVTQLIKKLFVEHSRLHRVCQLL